MVPCSSGNSNTMSVVEVGFREARGRGRGVRPVGLTQRVRRDRSRQRRHSFRLGAIAPELLVKGDGVQASSRSSSRLRRSASQKNLASRNRAVTTRSAFLAIGRSSDGEVLTTARNASLSSPRSSVDREEMLMMNERGRQHLVRQGQKRAIEEAGDDARILDEIGHLIDQRGMIPNGHAPARASSPSIRAHARCGRDAQRDRARRSAPPDVHGSRRRCGP